MTAPVITRDEAKLMLLAVAKQHADAGNAWQAASIVAAVDALSAPAPAIDLEQFRRLAHGWVVEAGGVAADVKHACSDELLALIDGQAEPRPLIARQLAEWQEDDGPAMWWGWCGRDWAGEPAWYGTPNDSDWPGYHTHWTPHPAMPMPPTKGEGE